MNLKEHHSHSEDDSLVDSPSERIESSTVIVGISTPTQAKNLNKLSCTHKLN